jgi:hypothetical protein
MRTRSILTPKRCSRRYRFPTLSNRRSANASSWWARCLHLIESIRAAHSVIVVRSWKTHAECIGRRSTSTHILRRAGSEVPRIKRPCDASSNRLVSRSFRGVLSGSYLRDQTNGGNSTLQRLGAHKCCPVSTKICSGPQASHSNKLRPW